tara:strand:- start:218 stop:508 length:291 start_codon:yes stop_codon:yes gene_type:complete
MNELVANVEKWSKDKGLDKADPRAQFLKVVEEVGEIAAAMARNDRPELIDGIGDVVVTLIILAQQHDLDIEHCLASAWDEIENRTGNMQDGVFIKD